jgi:hypothetical protein
LFEIYVLLPHSHNHWRSTIIAIIFPSLFQHTGSIRLKLDLTQLHNHPKKGSVGYRGSPPLGRLKYNAGKGLWVTKDQYNGAKSSVQVLGEGSNPSMNQLLSLFYSILLFSHSYTDHPLQNPTISSSRLNSRMRHGWFLRFIFFMFVLPLRSQTVSYSG